MNKKHPPFHSPLNRKRAYNPGLELINPLSFSVKKLHYRRTITLLPPRLEPSRADTRCIKQFGYTRLEGAAEPRAPLSRFPWGCLIPSSSRCKPRCATRGGWIVKILAGRQVEKGGRREKRSVSKSLHTLVQRGRGFKPAAGI